MSISDSHTDTSAEEATKILHALCSPARVAPFEALASFVKTALFSATNDVEFCEKGEIRRPDDKSKKLGVAHAQETMRADANKQGLTSAAGLYSNAQCLNAIMRTLHAAPQHVFTDHLSFENDLRYYEQIIFESKQIPTRRNWHDFFNGLIWSQFPQSKSYFNKSHIEQIALSGNVKKRTPQRDKLTHFDECGLVLFTSCAKLPSKLVAHDWQTLFIDDKGKWHTHIVPVIFGHALWEMLLNPFIGLTAKATVIHIDNTSLSQLNNTAHSAEFYAACDTMLLEHLQDKRLIDAKRPWLPIPLLGIPQWSHVEQSASFYANTQYFMPKRR